MVKPSCTLAQALTSHVYVCTLPHVTMQAHYTYLGAVKPCGYFECYSYTLP